MNTNNMFDGEFFLTIGETTLRVSVVNGRPVTEEMVPCAISGDLVPLRLAVPVGPHLVDAYEIGGVDVVTIDEVDYVYLWHEDEWISTEETEVVTDHDSHYVRRYDALRLYDRRWAHVHDENLRLTECGDYFIEGDEGFVYIDGDGYRYRNDCHYCEVAEDWVYGEEEDCECCNPPDTGERVNRYHHSPRPTLYYGTSPYLVGFEVEKTSAFGADSEGDEVEETPLFAGWEADASCGVEGITHAYDPLDPVVRRKFCQDRLDSDSAFDDNVDASCGGHINLSSTVHTPRELFEKFRVYAPLWYACFRFRLNGTYTNLDKKLEGRSGEKYCPVRTKSFGIEIRIPNRVSSSDVLQRRFDWMGLTCQAITDGLSFNAYVKACSDLLLNGSYGGDRAKYAMILRLARHFRRWMLDGVIHPSIAQWV